MGMIEIVVLLTIIVTAIFLTGITASFGSENKHSGRTDYYGKTSSIHMEDKRT